MAALAALGLHATAQTPFPPDSLLAEERSQQPQAQRTGGEVVPQEKLPVAPRPLPASPTKLAGAFYKATPASLRDLKSIEQHVKNLVTRVSPAVVAVRIGGSTGTGVVISDDGLVLSAAHVCERPDREVQFTFPGGKTARGKTLGTNHELDAGLMKITDAGKWPHVGVANLDQARLGDWVLGLGHPGGFDPQRAVVARLGRIITLTANALQTDCTLMAGDSGGPLFDMHGRALGIHSRISESTAENFHVPIGAYTDTWERLAKGESWGEQRPPPRPWVGARSVDDPEGCRLERISEDGPALKAGLKVGDVVLKINGERIADSSAFLDYVAKTKPGDELTFEIKRDDQEMSVKVKVETRRRRF